MLELRGSLSEQKNIIARLFHFDLKDLIKRSIDIMEKMPVPSITPHNLECYNSRLFIEIRDYLLAREPSPRNQNIILNLANFVILLYDSDEGWRCIIDEALRQLQRAELKYEPVTTPKWWPQNGDSDGKEE